MDPFVRAALREFDYKYYHSLKGHSRKPLPSKVLEAQFLVNMSVDTSVDPPIMQDPRLHASFTKALEYVKQAFKVKKYEPLKPREVVSVFKLSTSAGFSYYPARKKDVQDKIIDDVNAYIQKIVSGEKIVAPPCMLASRGKLSTLEDRKGRIIYVYPWEQSMLESCFSVPMTEMMKWKDDSVMMFGPNILPRLKREVATSYRGNMFCLKGDLSKFDVRVKDWFLKIALEEVIEPNIDFEHWNGKRMSPSSQSRYYRIWALVKEYIRNTPVMLPSGRIIHQKGKISSGSSFTSLLGSIINMLYMLTAAYYFNHPVKRVRVLGDDGFLVLEFRPNLDKWSEFYDWAFGAKLSPEKTKVYKGTSAHKEFLGYSFKNGSLYMPERDLFMKSLYPETEVDTVEKSISRLYAYMFLGGAGNERYTNFVRYFSMGYPIDYYKYLEVDQQTRKKMSVFGMDFLKKKRLFEFTLHDFVTRALTIVDINLYLPK